MKKRAPILSYLVLAVATVGIVGGGFVRSRNRTSAERTATEERASLAGRRHGLDEQLVASERKQVELRAELDRLTAEQAKAVGPPLRRALPPQRSLSAEQVATQGKQFKARLAVKYAAFYRAAGFDEAMIRHFEQQLAEHDAQENDLWTIARDTPRDDRTVMESIQFSNGTTAEQRLTPAIAATRRQQLAQFQVEQIALLGEAGYRRLQEFQRDEGKRLVVSQLVSDLTLTSTSLTPVQSGQLTVALNGVDFGGKLAPGVAQWPEILARAQGLLSAPQLAALKKQAVRTEHLAAMAAMTKLVEQEGK